MGKQFDDLLDEITEVRRNVAMSNDTLLEPRVARLERIIQTLLLALVEQAGPEDDRIGSPAGRSDQYARHWQGPPWPPRRRADPENAPTQAYGACRKSSR
jgi:hypothetical protein